VNRPESRRLKVITILAVILFCMAGTVQAQFSPEEVKGEFVERFSRFVEWPTSLSKGDSTEPFVVIIAGNCNFEKNISRAFHKRLINGRKPVVRVIPSGAQIPKCDLVFLAKSEKNNLERLLSFFSGKPVLTVADTKGFGERGVHINLFEEGDHARFEINLASVRKSGLKISSRLLRHAKIIDPDRN